jgi:CreA protein
VSDLDAARARLEARDDVRFDGETCTIEGWVRLATLYDPDGNVLMLYEDVSSPKNSFQNEAVCRRADEASF